MKKLTLLSLIAVFIFASCTTTTAPAPKKTVDVDNLEFYAPGKDTTVSWKNFQKKFHKGHLETCPGEFRPVKWISYDSTNHSVTLRLQGERITADSLKKILNPNEVPVVTTPPASDENVSDGGTMSSGSSNSGFLSSIPDWLWFLLIAALVAAIIYAIVRSARRRNSSEHSTVEVVGLAPHVRTISDALNRSTEAVNKATEATHNNSGQLVDNNRLMQQQVEAKAQSSAGQRITVKIEGSGNNVINIDYKKSSQQPGNDAKQDVDIHIGKEATGANNITIKND